MKKIIIGLILIIIVSLFIMFKPNIDQVKEVIQSPDNKENLANNSEGNEELKGELYTVKEGDKSLGEDSDGDEESSKKGLENPDNSSEEEIEIIPPDLESRECGFYYREYGVCGGYCPSGICTNEGRSCYCK